MIRGEFWVALAIWVALAAAAAPCDARDLSLTEAEKLLAAHNRELRAARSEEHTSELQSLRHLVCRLLHEKKKWYSTAQIDGPSLSTNLTEATPGAAACS